MRRASMEENDLKERVASLEKMVGELTRVVYLHATALASIKREFEVHYHRRDGQTLPFVLNSSDTQLKLVAAVSLRDYDVKQQIEQYESDPQAFLKNNYGDLFYWPWE
jgi:hypothetical protein